MNKHDRELLKKKHMKVRDQFEIANCGKFRRCFPHEDKVSLTLDYSFLVTPSEVRQTVAALDDAPQSSWDETT
jgi:hypothetical protein